MIWIPLARAHSQKLPWQNIVRLLGFITDKQEHIWVKRTRLEIMQKIVIFFSTSEIKYTNLKTVQIKSKNMECIILSIGVIIC